MGAVLGTSGRLISTHIHVAHPARPRSGGGRPASALQEQAGVPDAASEGPRRGQTPAVREAPQPRRNSGLPVRSLRCLVVSVVVVSTFALVTERLSP